MASFREIREALFLSHASGFIDDIEFLLLHEEYTSDNLDFPYGDHPKFHLPDKNEAECKANFRVEKHHIPRLVDALDIPAVFTCEQGTVCEGTEGLCILLKRFAYPCRYSDLVPIFGRPVPELCMINNTVMDFIYDNHRQRIMDWNPNVLNTERSYKTRLNCSDCQSKIPNARIGLVDYQRSYLCTFKFPQLRFERT